MSFSTAFDEEWRAMRRESKAVLTDIRRGREQRAELRQALALSAQEGELTLAASKSLAGETGTRNPYPTETNWRTNWGELPSSPVQEIAEQRRAVRHSGQRPSRRQLARKIAIVTARRGARYL